MFGLLKQLDWRNFAITYTRVNIKMELNFSTTFELFAFDVVIEICELWPSFTFFTSAWNCFYLPPTRLTLFVMCRSFPCTEHWALQFLSAWLQLNFLMFINQPKRAKKITGQNGQKWTHAAPQYASSWNNTKTQGWFLQCFDLRALQDFLF